MHMYESHDHTMPSVGVIAILVKMTFWPLWLQIQIMVTTFVEGVKLINMHESRDHAM